MNAPYWLSDLLSVLMIALGLYSLWRLPVSRAWGRTVDYEADVLHLLAGVAAAGLISSWARTLPRPVWLTLFAAGGVYFALRAAREWGTREQRGRMLGAAGCCAVLVYAFAAGVGPSTLHGSTAGQYTMADTPGMMMDQTERFPALGLILVVGLAFAAVVLVNRAGSAPSAKPVPAVGGPRDGAPVPLAPRSAELCRVVLLLVLAYVILSKLV